MSGEISILAGSLETMGLKENMSSHSLRGLSLISDLCILEGIYLAISGLVLLLYAAFYAIIPIGAGVVLVVMGYYLDDLHRFAWWAVITTSFLSLAGTTIGSLYSGNILQIPIGLTNFVSFVVNLVLGILIVGYLLKSNVRALFFEESMS
jgi:hypothetical protein